MNKGIYSDHWAEGYWGYYSEWALISWPNSKKLYLIVVFLLKPWIHVNLLSSGDCQTFCCINILLLSLMTIWHPSNYCNLWSWDLARLLNWIHNPKEATTKKLYRTHYSYVMEYDWYKGFLRLPHSLMCVCSRSMTVWLKDTTIRLDLKSHVSVY